MLIITPTTTTTIITKCNNANNVITQRQSALQQNAKRRPLSLSAKSTKSVGQSNQQSAVWLTADWLVEGLWRTFWFNIVFLLVAQESCKIYRIKKKKNRFFNKKNSEIFLL